MSFCFLNITTFETIIANNKYNCGILYNFILSLATACSGRRTFRGP